MKRTIIIVFIGIALANCKPVQVKSELNEILSTLDFESVKAYTDTLSKKDKNIRIHWNCLRDLTEDFKEAVFYIETHIPDKDNPYISTVNTVRVTIITTDKKIAYYEISNQLLRKVDEKWLPYFETINKYRNDSVYANLKKTFFNIYRTELNEGELFNEDVVYGHSCTITGTDPKEKVQIDKFVEKRDKENLIKWLQSTNTEKQIYAIDGLSQLKKLGIKFTDQELSMIKFVVNKKGTIHVCSGCSFFQEEISEVTKKFEF